MWQSNQHEDFDTDQTVSILLVRITANTSVTRQLKTQLQGDIREMPDSVFTTVAIHNKVLENKIDKHQDAIYKQRERAEKGENKLMYWFFICLKLEQFENLAQKI